MKLWIYWSESNSWNYFYIVLNKNWKNLLILTMFYWSWAGGLVITVMTYRVREGCFCITVNFIFYLFEIICLQYNHRQSFALYVHITKKTDMSIMEIYHDCIDWMLFKLYCGVSLTIIYLLLKFVFMQKKKFPSNLPSTCIKLWVIKQQRNNYLN
jgi:hypothetical protein